MKKRLSFSRYISTINRLGIRYYVHEHGSCLVGEGQYFFLTRIYENPGISILDLARYGHFDKGTATRATQKLEEQGYLRRETDHLDKRVQRLYVTDRALPILEAVYASNQKWNDILTRGMTKEQTNVIEQLLDHMARNAYEFIQSIKEDSNERNHNK